MVGKPAKVIGALMAAWWLLLLVVIGLIGNGYMALLAYRSGSVIGVLIFVVCFCACIVYLFRTFKYQDEYRAIFKD